MTGAGVPVPGAEEEPPQPRKKKKSINAAAGKSVFVASLPAKRREKLKSVGIGGFFMKVNLTLVFQRNSGQSKYQRTNESERKRDFA